MSPGFSYLQGDDLDHLVRSSIRHKGAVKDNYHKGQGVKQELYLLEVRKEMIH